MGAIGGLWCFVWSVRQLILGCIDLCAKHPDTQQSMAFSHQTVHEIETTSLPANGMQELNDAARQAAMQQEQHVHASTPQLQDVTKLRELKQMMDDGIISQDDFDKKKMEILSRV